MDTCSNIEKHIKWGKFYFNLNDKAFWYKTSIIKGLSEDFIREFSQYVYWPAICSTQILSENFIREFQDQVIWFNVSMFQKLSENFILEFSDKVHWNIIGQYQKLSLKFIKQFEDKLGVDNLFKNLNLSDNTHAYCKRKYIKKFYVK